MTPRDYQTERNYRVQERLAIMCGKNQPTKQQIDDATKEAESDLERIEHEEVFEGWRI
jgi:hypothetical protein